MAYSETLNFVTGDTLPALILTLKDKNSAASGSILDPDNSATWEPINISGATVRLRLRLIGETALADTRTCLITDATAGVCQTDFADLLARAVCPAAQWHCHVHNARHSAAVWRH